MFNYFAYLFIYLFNEYLSTRHVTRQVLHY